MKKLNFFLIVLAAPVVLFAARMPPAVPPGKWRCMTFDLKENTYSGIGTSIYQAAHESLSYCRRKSTLPKTCRVAQSFCEQGPLADLGDTCLVTDEQGHSWDTTGADACRSAMEMCAHFQWLYNLPTACSVKHR